MELPEVLIVLLHSSFEVLLGVSNVDFTCVLAFDFVHHNGLSANIIVVTACLFSGSTIAREGFKVFAGDVFVDLGGEVCLKNFSKIGESVVRH